VPDYVLPRKSTRHYSRNAWPPEHVFTGMSPKSLFALSVASVGLVLSQVSLRADDTVQPPPPGVDAPPPPPPGGHGRGREGFKLAELTAKLGLTPDEVKVIEPII
jgi:hypothetical protein